MSSDETNNNDRTAFLDRRRFLGQAAGGLAAAGVASVATTSPSAAQSVAWKQAGNNNHVLELQKTGAQPAAGQVALDYFGHCSFRITTPKGLTLLFDPWRNDPSGAWGIWFPKEFPKVKVDVGLSTHTHFDHDATDRIEASAILDRFPGSWSFADVTITATADKHATDAPGWYKWINAVKESGADPYPPNNPGHLDNVSYVVETGGVRILIWGDNRHNPPQDVWDRWGHIDLLTLPVDGSQHILSYAQGNEIVERLKPKIVVPTHYLASGVSSTLSTLQTADEWVNSQPKHRALSDPRLVLDPSAIASFDRDFHYFGAAVTHGDA